MFEEIVQIIRLPPISLPWAFTAPVELILKHHIAKFCEDNLRVFNECSWYSYNHPEIVVVFCGEMQRLKPWESWRIPLVISFPRYNDICNYDKANNADDKQPPAKNIGKRHKKNIKKLLIEFSYRNP